MERVNHQRRVRLLLTGVLILGILAFTDTTAGRWAEAALPVLTAVFLFLSGVYHRKATGNTDGLMGGSLGAASVAVFLAASWVSSLRVQLVLTLAGMIMTVAALWLFSRAAQRSRSEEYRA